MKGGQGREVMQRKHPERNLIGTQAEETLVCHGWSILPHPTPLGLYLVHNVHQHWPEVGSSLP